MKKNLIIALLVAALVITAVVGGTFAYLTASDSDINVMTTGNVDIALIEQQRNTQTGALEDFAQDKKLVPFVGDISSLDDLGMPDTDDARNFVDKIVRVENTGRSNAYVRVLVAVPTALENAVHIVIGDRFVYNTTANADWGWVAPSEPATYTIDGKDYSVYTYVAKTALEPNDVSDAVITGVYLDSAVDYDDDTQSWTLGETVLDYDLNEGVLIPVFAQAIQADGFDTAAEAFAVLSPDSNPWADVVTVNDEAQLTEAIRTGKNIVLTADIELTSELEIGANVTIDGNGYSLSGENVSIGTAAKSVVIKDVIFDGNSITAADYAGTLVVRECTFGSEEKLDITPADGADIYVTDNNFVNQTQTSATQ